MSGEASGCILTYSPEERILFGFALAVVLVLNIPANLGIVWYEHKVNANWRTLVDKLVVLLACHLTVGILLWVAGTFGVVVLNIRHPGLCAVTVALGGGLFSSVVLILVEIVFVWLLYAVVLKTVGAVDEWT